MGGHLSHEYHYLEPIGEAKLQNCPKCQSYSIDATENEEDSSECPECHAKNMEKTSGIEVRKEKDSTDEVTNLEYFRCLEK